MRSNKPNILVCFSSVSNIKLQYLNIDCAEVWDRHAAAGHEDRWFPLWPLRILNEWGLGKCGTNHRTTSRMKSIKSSQNYQYTFQLEQLYILNWFIYHKGTRRLRPWWIYDNSHHSGTTVQLRQLWEQHPCKVKASHDHERTMAEF